RRQGRRLARTGAPDKQYQATFFHHRAEQHFRQLQVFETGNIQLDVARDDGHLVALLEDVDTRASDAGHGNRQVHLQLAFEFLALRTIHDRIGDDRDVAGFHRLLAQRLEHAVELGTGRRAGGEVEVGAI